MKMGLYSVAIMARQSIGIALPLSKDILEHKLISVSCMRVAVA